MAENLLTVTFDDDSLLTLRARSSGGFFIYYEDTQDNEIKLAGLSESIDYDLAKSIFFTIADRWFFDEVEVEEVYEDESEEDEEEL